MPVSQKYSEIKFVYGVTHSHSTYEVAAANETRLTFRLHWRRKRDCGEPLRYISSRCVKNERAVNARDVKFMIRGRGHAAWNAFKMQRAFSSIRFSFFYTGGYVHFSRSVIVTYEPWNTGLSSFKTWNKTSRADCQNLAQFFAPLMLHRNNAELLIP